MKTVYLAVMWLFSGLCKLSRPRSGKVLIKKLLQTSGQRKSKRFHVYQVETSKFLNDKTYQVDEVGSLNRKL